MLFSFNLLKKLSKAPKNWKVEDMVIAFNKLGFEVEGTEKFTDAEGVKFGKLLSISKNPEGTKLNVCEIEFNDGVRTIQTTDNGVIGNEGKVVMAFVPGSKLGNMTFADRKMKGIVSQGMLCAFSELVKENFKDSLPTEWEGTLQIFDADMDINQNPLELFGFDDHIIEIDILSNRSDSNSYFVMAQELMAYLNIDSEPQFNKMKEGSFDTEYNVSNGNADLLSIAEANIEDLEVTLEEKLLLLKSGVKSTLPIVDITNLALLMTGQPVHAYNKKKLTKNIVAKDSSTKAKIIGEKEIDFEDSLLIWDDEKAISAAGVMGFHKTAVNEHTKEVILEIGNFNIKKVRHTAKQTKLESMSSRQSSKKLGVGTQELGWTYLTNRIPNISNVKGMPKTIQKELAFDKKILNSLIGKELTNEEFSKLSSQMNSLGFVVKETTIIVPNYRHDIESQQDFNEEFIRLYGYDNFQPIAPSVQPSSVVVVNHKHKDIAAMGYQEVWTYSLISKERNIFNPFNFDETIELETFISKEREVIRNSMAMSLLEVIEYNSKRKMDEISIFDIGHINNGVFVAALASTTKTFKEMKQDVMNIIKKPVKFERATGTQFHEGVSALIKLEDKTIGWIGKVHPLLNSTEAFIAEIIIDQETNGVSFKTYDESQLKVRNITFELKDKEEIALHVEGIKTIPGIFSVKVSDIFIKDEIRKVTLAVKGDDSSIDEFDKRFN
ncbi:phenylalanine--tRNA ligase subunit beta [Mycoplasma todarodis]|uniref:Phenylalanine--tRNA ligase beta subunit n=1 Tax=Mycoplasma todarodis TaxID=1937191 RepID=A0A4R0XJF9_9MOLU|nr:phenylalanine--tRNA ligase subunit beta [Mycoplasma todarodis]TCG10753.1 phenylalanine--tRNA ligase subunit beta [Mycoplasma todarodis]